jgi:hypothetical protein
LYSQNYQQPWGQQNCYEAWNWNPKDLDLMALPPCHVFCQFYVSRLLNEFIFTLVCWQCVSGGGPWLLWIVSMPTSVLAKWSRNTEGLQQRDATLYSIHNQYLIHNNSTISTPNFVSTSKVTSIRSCSLLFYGLLLCSHIDDKTHNTQPKMRKGFADPLALFVSHVSVVLIVTISTPIFAIAPQL